jgi:isopentenyl-diphosphate delta-isomerase
VNNSVNNISSRKKEHLELCLNSDVSFRDKTNGFEHYDFEHYAITEVDISKINFRTKFLNKKINLPFLISCMTGGASEAENINAQLAVVAEELNIPIGVGSQRALLDEKVGKRSYNIIRKNAPSVPILSNIGAAEVVRYNSIDPFRKMIDMIEADGLVIHVNPLQELLQMDEQPNFKGLIKKIKKLIKEIDVPIIIKEVGAGISAQVAAKLLDAGASGIDVAGAGGTSWAGVEILRKQLSGKSSYLDWGLPTSYCIKEVAKLKKKFKFFLIGSGGINSGTEAAKAFALGADVVASARIILKELDKNGIDGTKSLIQTWFDTIRNVMFLTGSQTFKEFKKNKIFRKDLLY